MGQFERELFLYITAIVALIMLLWLKASSIDVNILD